MGPANTATDIFVNGTPADWLIHAGGISSIVVAPAIMLLALILWLRRASLRRWAWFLCCLPAIVAGTEFWLELRRLAADTNQVWSRDWNWNSIYADAYARFYFGSAFTLLFLLFTVAVRFNKRSSPILAR